MKTCATCEYYGGAFNEKCRRKVIGTDPVTGLTKYKQLFADMERTKIRWYHKLFKIDKCGLDGQYWKERYSKPRPPKNPPPAMHIHKRKA